MNSTIPKKTKTIVGREELMTYKKCPVCGELLTLGEVMTYAFDVTHSRDVLVHINEAIFNNELGCYIVRY